MMMTSEWAFILDEVDELSEMIRQSTEYRALQQAHEAVYSNEVLVQQIEAFNRMKEQYEDVQRFGKYHPDYKTIMKDIRHMKRALDVDERVSNLRLAENRYQDLLDEVSLIIGKSVSQAVKVPVSNPFFSQDSGCGSGCGSGGSCSCSAS
jgi:cell fate (sporulation/competence/biofilm development) regulator YlbF (YheA/YmcA/DUF963 family)